MPPKETLQPVFSSPTLAGGKLLVGEGYHRNEGCRLLCLDPDDPKKIHWAAHTASHVESSPAVSGDRVFVGAGDDGLVCYSMTESKRTRSRATDDLEDPPLPRPKQLSRVEDLHIDAAPAVADGRVFTGSAIGDLHGECCVLACDAQSGKLLWKVAAPLPVPNAAAVDGNAVVFALGSGRLNEKESSEGGFVWCMNAVSGELNWDVATSAAIGGCPVALGGRVWVVARDGHCYCLNQADGRAVWECASSNRWPLRRSLAATACTC